MQLMSKTYKLPFSCPGRIILIMFNFLSNSFFNGLAVKTRRIALQNLFIYFQL